MAEWRDRSEMNGDVVFFGYVSEGMEKSHEEVYVWDLDKTYLDTTIDSLSGLLNTVLEKALQKKNVPEQIFLCSLCLNTENRKKGICIFLSILLRRLLLN